MHECIPYAPEAGISVGASLDPPVCRTSFAAVDFGFRTSNARPYKGTVICCRRERIHPLRKSEMRKAECMNAFPTPPKQEFP